MVYFTSVSKLFFKKTVKLAVWKMSTGLDLKLIPTVEIDSEGKFKYILIKLTASQKPDGINEISKIILRGNKRGAYHNDIFEETIQKLKDLNLQSTCLGGGRIQHNPEEKSIKVYSSSTGYGRADHELAAGLLKEVYGDYNVTWSNED